MWLSVGPCTREVSPLLHDTGGACIDGFTHTHLYPLTYLWHQIPISPQRCTKVPCLLFIYLWFWRTRFISLLLRTVLSYRDSFYSQIQKSPSFVAHSPENQLIVWTSALECFFRSHGELNLLSNSCKNPHTWALVYGEERIVKWNCMSHVSNNCLVH